MPTRAFKGNLRLRDAVLLAVGAYGAHFHPSVTRLQKALFLAQREGLVADIEFARGTAFSMRIYDEIECLDNLGLVRMRSLGLASREEARDVDRVRWSFAIGGSDGCDEGVGADHYEANGLQLTAEGISRHMSLVSRACAAALLKTLLAVRKRTDAMTIGELGRYCLAA